MGRPIADRCGSLSLCAMSLDTFTAALLFSLVMGFTPGPNNVMLASSGANYGVSRTWPHLWGVTLGFPVMLLVIGLGLATILLASAGLQLGMKIVSCLYLLWLALQIARSSPVKAGGGSGKPLSFLQAAGFQWINPKAWLIAVGAISAYTAGTGAHLYGQVAIIAVMSVAVTFLSTLTWTVFGAAIGRFLRAPIALTLFNLAMALLLLGSIVPILSEIWEQVRR